MQTQLEVVHISLWQLRQQKQFLFLNRLNFGGYFSASYREFVSVSANWFCQSCGFIVARLSHDFRVGTYQADKYFMVKAS